MNQFNAVCVSGRPSFRGSSIILIPFLRMSVPRHPLFLECQSKINYFTILPGLLIKSCNFALADVARWIGHRPANLKVTILFPSQGTCLGGRLGPWLGAGEGQPIMHLSHMDVPLSFSLFFPVSKKVNEQNLLKNSCNFIMLMYIVI